VFKPVGILFTCLAFCLAGCTTVPPENPPGETWVAPTVATNTVTSTTTRFVTNIVTRVVVKPRVPPPVKVPPPINQVTNLNRPVVQFNPPPPVVSKPVDVWTSLNRWAVQHDLTPPQRLAGTALVRYAVGTPLGVIVLEIGSHDATWNGIEVRLAYPPEIADDQIFVHGLDLEKTLAPLLFEKPSATSTNRVIVIDPGHGGINGGTISVLDGKPEKMFTLDWARRLAPLLEAKGWRVILTRTNDIDIVVTNRVNFAVAHHADLFVSLHFNSSAPDQKQAGLETYCLTPTGMPSTITRGYPDLAWQSFPANFYDEQSLLLAVRLHKAILRATGEEDRGVRRARFLGILRGQHCPCVLIEGGYLSSPYEARKIENAEYRQKLAEAVAGALK
jgi:N-acetylmuramoyl-L-alanine amidase